MAIRSLAHLLLQEEVLGRDVLENSLARANREGLKLAAVLLDEGLIEERRLAQLVSTEAGVALLEFLPEAVPAWVYRRLPGPIAREYHAVPLTVDDGRITVAVLDPTDTGTQDVLRAATDMEIVISTALKSQLDHLLDVLYPLDVDLEATIISERNLRTEDDTGDHVAAEEPGLQTMSIDAGTVQTPSMDARVNDIALRLSELTRQVAELQSLVDALRQDLRRSP